MFAVVTIGIITTLAYFQLSSLKNNSKIDKVNLPDVKEATSKMDGISKNDNDESLADDVATQKIDYEGFRSELKKVFSGEISFVQKAGSFDSYTYGNNGYWGIDVYKYVPGKNVISYEHKGDVATRDLKKEVDQFKVLKLGDQQAYFVGIQGSLVNTNLIEFGTKKYALVDIPDGPSGSMSRYYYLYDEKNSQMVYLYITFYNLWEINNFNQNWKITEKIKYPDNYQTFLDSFEQNVLAKN